MLSSNKFICHSSNNTCSYGDVTYVRQQFLSEGTYGAVYRYVDPEHIDRSIVLKFSKMIYCPYSVAEYKSEAMFNYLMYGMGEYGEISLGNGAIQSVILEPYIDGYSLKNLHKGLSLYELNFIFVAIIEAAVAMHNKNIVHEDIYDANIQFSTDKFQRYKAHFIDFGMTRLIGDQVPRRNFGAIRWYAPELSLSGVKQTANPSHDIYSLGKLFYKLYRENRGKSEPDHLINLSFIIDRMQESNPQKRTPSLTIVLQQLKMLCAKQYYKKHQSLLCRRDFDEDNEWLKYIKLQIKTLSELLAYLADFNHPNKILFLDRFGISSICNMISSFADLHKLLLKIQICDRMLVFDRLVRENLLNKILLTISDSVGFNMFLQLFPLEARSRVLFHYVNELVEREQGQIKNALLCIDQFKSCEPLYKELLLAFNELYSARRKLNPDSYKSSYGNIGLSLFGCHSRLEKLLASEHLKESVSTHKNLLTNTDLSALSQGELGLIGQRLMQFI